MDNILLLSNIVADVVVGVPAIPSKYGVIVFPLRTRAICCQEFNLAAPIVIADAITIAY